jgi:hypothetical protein
LRNIKIPVIAEKVYAIVDAIAAPFIPNIGINVKSRAIVVIAEITVVYVPYSGFPVPEKPAQSTLLMLMHTIPGISRRRGVKEVTN